MRRARVARACGFFLLLSGCAVDGVLGSFSGETMQEVGSETGGATGSGGGDAGIGGQPMVPTIEDSFAFLTSFEVGESPSYDEYGAVRIVGSGSWELRELAARSGEVGFVPSLEQRGGYVFYFIPAPSHFRGSVYLMVPEYYDTQTVVVEKIMYQVPPDTEEFHAFDVNIQRADPTGYRLTLYDHGTGENIGQSTLTFITNTWVEISVEFIASLDGQGSISVLLNDEIAIDTGHRDTVDPNHSLLFGAGAIAQSIAPNPSEFYLDDFSISDLSPE